MKLNVTHLLFKRPNLRVFLFATILVFISSITSSFASDYYFSSSSGDDNRSSNQAQNSATPWRSIDKLNSISNELKGGDRILFKSGDTFYGSIFITRGGSSGNPITYSSYDSGAKPIITSMVRVNNWISIGNGIYEASVSIIDAGTVQVVSINNQLREVGRYPNSGTTNGGYLTISSVNNNFSIQGANMPTSYAGGEIVMRKNNWITDRHVISSNSGSTINFESNPKSGYVPQKGFGYFVQNHVNTLDLYGEWAYSKSSKKIYGNFGGQNPNELNVQVATRDYLIFVNKYVQNLTFNNLNLLGANLDIFNIQNSANVQILNSQLIYAGQYAIYAHTTPDLVVKNNNIDNSLNGAIFFHFSTPRAVIEDNIINHTMPFQGMGGSSDMKGLGVYIAGDANNSRVLRNQIYNSGFNGIHFGGNYTVIKNNIIDSYCLFKHDGGGIYTNSDGMAYGNNEGREIVGNIVIRGLGAVEGTTMKDNLAEGIYIDDNANGIKIINNTVSYVSGKGLYLHNASNIEILDNLFYNIPIQMHIGDDKMGKPVRNVRVEGNQFSKVLQQEIPYSISSSMNDIPQFGNSNNNYFLDPFGAELMFKSQGPNDGPVGRKWNIKNWFNEYGHDRNSLRPDFDLQRYVITSSSTVKESDFSSNLEIVSGVYNGYSELSTGINGGVWKLNLNQSANGSAFIQIGSVSTGDEFLIEFDTKSINPDQTVEVLLEKTFNQNQDGNIFNFVTSNETKKVKILLKAEIASGNESIVFRFPKTLGSILLDNMKISKVKTQAINIDDFVFFEYNYSNQSVTYPLSGSYKNGKGEVFKGSVSIPAYGSALLVKTEDGPANNVKPSVSIYEPAQNQIFQIGNEILIKANASDPIGQVQKVEFYVNEILVNTDSQSPYQYALKNAPVGNHVLKAKVYNNSNVSAESSKITIKVENGVELEDKNNQAPLINIVTPNKDQTFKEGETILIQSYVQARTNEIAKVEFFSDDKLVGSVTSAPYQINWTDAAVGSHSLKTRVTDNGGLTAVSYIVNISVTATALKNQAPFTSIVTPDNNQSFGEGTSILVQSYAIDPENDIAKVEFFNGNTLIGSVTEAPYQINWNNAAAGTHSLKTRVIDGGGLSSESAVVYVNVTSIASPNQSPFISIVTPYNNESFDGGTVILIQSYVTDPENKIEKVEFFSNTILVGSVTSAPYQIEWSNAKPGSYSLKSRVTDSGGLTDDSELVRINVNQTLSQKAGPLTSIVTPRNNQSYQQGSDILIQAYVISPDNKIAKVEFFNGNSLIGSVTEAPYQLMVPNVPSGKYVVKSRVTDGSGLTAESTIINVIVTNNWGARTSGMGIISPLNDQEFKSSDIIPIEVGSGFSLASYDSLEVFVGGEKKGATQSLLYELDASLLSIDKNQITVKGFHAGEEIASENVHVDILKSDKNSKSTSYDTFGEQEYTFEIGPNPTSDVLNIYLEKMYKGEDVEINIYSIDGLTLKVIQANTDTDKITIDVSGYSAGIYFIRIMGKVFVYETKRFIKN
jgi:hypothetical protein